MSLEQAIKDLTAAVEANTEALGSGGGESKAPAKTPAKAPAKKPAAKKPAAKKTGPGPDDLAEAFGKYMKAGSKEDRETAKTHVRAIISHFDVDRITNLDAEHYEEALDLLAQFQAGEDPLGDGEEDEEEDDSLM